MDWDRLRIFHAVVEAGSFTKAGRALDLSQSAISRQIGALDETLGVALFHRHTRGVVLTEQGDDFHATVREMAAKIEMARARINERRDQPEGPLKITTTVAFGSAWLTSQMNSFHTLYPDIAVSLLLVDNVELDLFLRHADIAVRFELQPQPNLIQCRLMSIRYHLFASLEYLARHPAPTCAADLDDHEIIVYGEDMATPVGRHQLDSRGRSVHPAQPGPHRKQRVRNLSSRQKWIRGRCSPVLPDRGISRPRRGASRPSRTGNRCILRVSGRAPSFTTHRGGAGFSARSGVQGGRRIETRCR